MSRFKTRFKTLVLPLVVHLYQGRKSSEYLCVSHFDVDTTLIGQDPYTMTRTL